MSTYTACVFLNLTSRWPTHLPVQVRRDFTSRAAALAWARMAPAGIPFAEPDVLVVGGPPGQPALAAMVFPDRIEPLEVHLAELPRAESPRLCHSGDDTRADVRVEAEGTEAAVWLCEGCLRDPRVLEAACRRLLAGATAPQPQAIGRRVLH